MSASTKEIVHQGYLTKSPSTKLLFKPAKAIIEEVKIYFLFEKLWKKKWFILRSGPYPNQFVLEYFEKKNCRRLGGTINLDECEQICGPLNVQDRHRYTFYLRTPGRTYYLAADSEEEMNKWIECLCQVCGLKVIEDDSEGIVYAKPSNENKPVATEVTESHHQNSAGSSPTPSNKSPSGPYIPISECFTGKPIIFGPNPNSNEEVTYYNVSSFPFPPKVNWATHPTGTDVATDGRPQGQKQDDVHYAPPRPPKKSSSKPTTPTTVTAQSKPSCSPKCPEDPQSFAEHSAGVYENLEENPETSSISSSLHSPPGSAGMLYCNIPDTTENKTSHQHQNSLPSASPSPSHTSASSVSAIPPKVDRNLKPEVKKAIEINAGGKNHSASSASTTQSRTGCMTLPGKSSQNNFYGHGTYYPGPEIDRTRKPSDGHLTLGSTPAQIRSQSAQNSSKATTNSRLHSSSTLPGNRRRAGPLISPHDKKSPAFHEYETAQELSGQYMQIDCQAIKESEARSHTLKLPNNKKLGGSPTTTEGSVEYRLIDHVKTKALNQMRLDREKQLQTNTTRH